MFMLRSLPAICSGDDVWEGARDATGRDPTLPLEVCRSGTRSSDCAPCGATATDVVRIFALEDLTFAVTHSLTVWNSLLLHQRQLMADFCLSVTGSFGSIFACRHPQICGSGLATS